MRLVGITMSKKKGKKNKHIKVGNQLRMVNKGWNHLKMKQKEWIMEQTNLLHSEKSKSLGRPLNKEEKKEIIDEIYSRIESKDIWIPYHVIKDKCSKKIAQRERKLISEGRGEFGIKVKTNEM